MKWFKDGLTKDELNKEYRALALKYHPDVSKEPDAEEKMKEINAEYDKYFVVIHYASTGYNANDIRETYSKARKERSVIFVFLRRDKKFDGNSWFTFNSCGKIHSTGPSWDNFHGGFALCKLTQEISTNYYFRDFDRGNVRDQEVEKLPASITCPTYADMYFGTLYGEFASESTQLATLEGEGERAELYKYNQYALVSTKQYGDVWISFSRIYNSFDRGRDVRYAYMMVNGRLMRARFGLDAKNFSFVERWRGMDFGYLAFQDCTAEEFANTHDVDFVHPLADAVECRKLTSCSNLLWIHEPIVEHYARLGIVQFYGSSRNFKLRYGTFSKEALEEHLHDIGIEEAEVIQDFLDKLNGEFDDAVRGMIKKGRIHIKV